MTAAILSIGTELTRGELVNTNASWLSARLVEMGFEVHEFSTVDDDLERISSAIRRLAAHARVVIATGGLGPTTDDLTAQAVAKALGVELIRDDGSLEVIRGRFASFGREMSPTNEKQADFPAGANILANAHGTAPGFSVELASAQLFFLPGVPREMQGLFFDHVAPRIAPLATRTTHQVRLRTFGLTESRVGELLAGLEDELPGVTLGYRATFPEIEVKVLARCADARDAEELAARGSAEARTRLGAAVYGEGEDTYAAYAGRMLRDRSLTLAVAESCTGGMVGQMITGVPGSSNYLLLDAVTYSNAAKTDLLGVSAELMRAYGAVSGEVATAMAEGALRVARSDLAVAITGIAGPGGGTDEKPVGTVWLALAQADKTTHTERVKLPGDRDRIRTLASYLALRLVADAARASGRV